MSERTATATTRTFILGLWSIMLLMAYFAWSPERERDTESLDIDSDLTLHYDQLHLCKDGDWFGYHKETEQIRCYNPKTRRERR